MTPYLDAGFVITLLIHTSGSRRAREVIRPFPAPFILNSLHQLQLENFLLRARLEGTTDQRKAGAASERLWRQYIAEGVIQISDIDWRAAFDLAVEWNRNYTTPAPPPLLLFHPAIAATVSATHFVSFDPRSRQAAKAAGLTVLPQHL